jgi:hypothetical protein
VLGVSRALAFAEIVAARGPRDARVSKHRTRSSPVQRELATMILYEALLTSSRREVSQRDSLEGRSKRMNTLARSLR